MQETNVPEAAPGLLAQLGWVDLTALALLAVFLVLGLFRGFVWQLSRIVTLGLAYVCSGIWGKGIADEIRPWFAADLPPELPLYLAYFVVFLGVLVVVSLVAHIIDRFLERTGLSFYNRLGGGVLGIATGAALVVAMLGTILMFFGRQGPVVQAAEKSHSLRLSRQVVGAFGRVVPPEIRHVFGLPVEVQGQGQAPRDPGAAPGTQPFHAHPQPQPHQAEPNPARDQQGTPPPPDKPAKR